MSEQKEGNVQDSSGKKNDGRKKSLALAFVLIAFGIAIVLTGVLRGNPEIAQIAALKEHMFSEAAQSKIATALQQQPAGDDIIIFLSICNTQERASVFKGMGASLESAWDSAVAQAAELIAAQEYDVVWAKADIVNFTEELSLAELNEQVAHSQYNYFFRKGIAFDQNFDIAFLEAEVNGNKIISYDTAKQIRDGQTDDETLIFSLTNINYYLQNYYDRSGLESIPKRVTAFTTMGFFCDEAGVVYDLYDAGLDYGRRIIDLADDKTIEAAIISASEYLYDLMQPDGKFIYGYFPIFDNELNSYNILRHSGSIWSLINLYRMTRDEALIPKLESAIAYLLTEAVEYKDATTAYVVERKADEIKLGGNGLAVIMLTEYMDVFETDEYVDVVRALANGILELEDLKTGVYYHVLNYPDYAPKEEYRTVYYDGEATFALARAYAVTQEQKYLDGAMMAVENFIAKDYTRYRDHWVAYALNEITKYAPEPRYYEFALENVSKNLDRIYNQATSYHTYLELLMVGWQTWERLQKSGARGEYIKDFDAQYLAETIYKRAFHMLNGYFYPEYAMYMKRPYKILNAFYIRHDNFRVRIDDIQHFIGGYYYYTLYFEELLPYLSEEFLISMHEGGLYSMDEETEIGEVIDE